MLDEERVVAVVGEDRVADVLVAPGKVPYLLHFLACVHPDATLFLEGEPQTAESIEAMLAEAEARRAPHDDVPEGEPLGLPALATADLVMRSLAQLQAQTFTSIIAASEKHLQATLDRDAKFADQLAAHRKHVREAIEHLDFVDRAAKLAEVEANFEMRQAQARGRQSEARTKPAENITFGDIMEGVQEMTTGPSRPNTN